MSAHRSQACDFCTLALVHPYLARLLRVAAVTLLRMRSLGGAGKYGSEQDARGVHLVLPELRRDCEAAWTQSFGRLSGEILGSCQMIPDALGAQLAAIDQVRIPRVRHSPAAH